ncbi:hypothetical protein AAHE18_14G032100 [Arachis hypogaea]|nr:uncharacterized protein DS421_14g449810 [Arachis hypogaea]
MASSSTSSSSSSSSSCSVHISLMIIIMASMPSKLHSSPSQPYIPKIPTQSSSSSATSTDPPTSSSSSSSTTTTTTKSPFQPLSPDIAPLFPSPGGGVFPTPASGSEIPTIPSTPSTPNPDDIIAPGPLSAFSPMQSSSTAPRTLASNAAIAAFAGLAAAYYCSMQHMRV